jgi:hypothetical protein
MGAHVLNPLTLSVKQQPDNICRLKHRAFNKHALGHLLYWLIARKLVIN